MSGHLRTSAALFLPFALAVASPGALTARSFDFVQTGPAAGETRPESVVAPPSKGLVEDVDCSAFEVDSPSPFGYEKTLDLGVQALHLARAEPDKDARKCLYRMAEAFSRHLLFENPNDPQPRHLYSVAMGLRARDEGVRTRVRLAQHSFEQAQLILGVVPGHAGAQHTMGRLYAHAMRLNGLKRFIAIQILGGEAMSYASWEEAESLLAAAARLQPEVADHHYQLGVLYLDTDRPELALAAFERVLSCDVIQPIDLKIRVLAREMVERLQGERVAA